MPDHIADNGVPESQLEMVRLLSAIQTSQKFMSDTLVEIKDDVKETKEATQGHALLIAGVKTDVEVLKTRLNSQEALLEAHRRSFDQQIAQQQQQSSQPTKSNMDAKMLGIFTALAGVTYGLIEIVKMLINYFTYHVPK